MLAAALSVSESGDHVFRVPLDDPPTKPSSAGGYPWEIGDFSTIFYVTNVSDEPWKHSWQVSYLGGVYSAGLQQLQPGETLSVDINALRDLQIPDAFGDTIPLEVQNGQILWSAYGTKEVVMLARVEMVDLSNGLSSTYACFNCCADSYVSSYVSPGSSTGLAGQSTQFTAFQENENCYGSQITPFSVAWAAWSSSNSSVASVNSSGLASCLQPGTSNVSASWDTSIWFNEGGAVFGECIEEQAFPQPMAPVKVIKVDIQNADITQDKITVDLDVGSGGASGQLKVELIGSGVSHTVFQATKSNGAHNISFNISNLPNDKEFTQVKATWTVDGTPANDTYNYHIKILGDYLITQYNVPKEVECDAGDGDACLTDIQCNYEEVEMRAEFIAEAFQNGHGLSENEGLLEWGDYCWTHGHPLPSGCSASSTFGRDTNGVVGTCSVEMMEDSHVARNPNHPDLSCNDKVFINTVGLRTVVDECPSCGTEHLDHFAGQSGCDDVQSLGSGLKTIKIF